MLPAYSCRLLFAVYYADQQVIQVEHRGVVYFAGFRHNHLDTAIAVRIVILVDLLILLPRVKALAVITHSYDELVLLVYDSGIQSMLLFILGEAMLDYIIGHLFNSQ